MDLDRGPDRVSCFSAELDLDVQHNYPFLELMHNIRESGRDLPFTPVGYIRAQILLTTPVTFPVWLLGGLYFFFFPKGNAFRVLGWTFISVLVTFIVLHGKDYYATPVYPMMFAGGAIAIEQISAAERLGWLKPLSVALVLLGTVALLPLFVPVLSPESFLIRFIRPGFRLRFSPTRRACLQSRCRITIRDALAGTI
jgi:hypothetical protein